MDVWFFLNSIFFGVALAMDAFSVSVANGIAEPKMSKRKRFLIAGIFGVFQLLMPLIGWFFVRKLTEIFHVMEKFIPWIALLLLLFLGGKMIVDGIRAKEEETAGTSFGRLLVQGIATSIDALSVGFTIAQFSFREAIVESGIIGLVTFAICLFGLFLGRMIGNKAGKRAPILGGIILILIGLEIFLTGIFG